MMPGLRATVIFIAVVLFLALVGTQVFLPPFFEARLEESLRTDFPTARSLDVTVGSFPAYRLLQGNLGRIDIAAEHIVLDDVPVDELHVQGRDVRLDLGHLLRTGRLRVFGATSLGARVAISEQSLNQYLRAEVDPSGFFRAEVEEGVVRLDGGVRVLGTPVSIQIDGDFEVQDGVRIEFVPRHVSVDEAVIPQFIIDSLTQSGPFRVGIDLDSLPIPLRVTRIDVQQGWIVIEARSPVEG